MNLNKRYEGDVLVLTVDEARIDAANAISLKDQFNEATKDETGRVVMDLTCVEFMDSSGLGAMVATMKQLGPDRKLELFGLSAAVDKVFTLTRMNTVFPIHDDLATALGSSDAEDNVSAA